jgi:hypothetical protein
MLTSGQGMFLLVPTNSKKPLLVPGKVTESNTSSFAINLDDACDLKAGLETLAYCDVRGKFFQQGATLAEITPTLPKITYVFTRVGEPVSAEQRQTFRVSVALSDINAQVGDRKYCQVVDFSPEGLAIISSPGLVIGATVKVTLNHEEHSLVADARIQTIKVMPTGKVRYGLLVPNTNAGARRTLLRMSMGFQRTQLKRLAGAA